MRLCVDFRKLNAHTVPDPYYIPLVEGLIDKIGEAKYLSKLNLAKGFNMVLIAEDTKMKTAFFTPFGKYEFTRMPFGLSNAPFTFQRLIDVVLSGLEEFASPYIDDIIVYSKSWVDHIQHIDEVLSKLAEAGLTDKPTKCEWGKKQVECLGHIVENGQCKVPEARVKCVQDFKLPVTKKDIRAFLGTIGYFRKYIPYFASHAKHLTASTAMTAPNMVTWTGEMLAAFHHLHKVLCQFCVLNVPVSNDNFVLQTDASYCGVSGVLSVFREGEELPVAFYYRQLKDRETRYSAMEVECLAAL